MLKAPKKQPQQTAKKPKQRQTAEKPKQGETAKTPTQKILKKPAQQMVAKPTQQMVAKPTQQVAKERGPPYFGLRPPFDAPFGAVWQKVATTPFGRFNVDDDHVVGHWILLPDVANFT